MAPPLLNSLTQAVKCTRYVFCCIFSPILQCNLLTHPKCCIKCGFLSIKPQIPRGIAPNWCFFWTYCLSFYIVTLRGESSLPTSKHWVLHDIKVQPRKPRLNFCPQIYMLPARALMLSWAHKLLLLHTHTGAHSHWLDNGFKSLVIEPQPCDCGRTKLRWSLESKT